MLTISHFLILPAHLWKMAFSALVIILLLGVSLPCISCREDSNVSATSFIRAKCRATTYPALCVRSLSVYATVIQRDPKKLAHTALSLSLKRAQSNKDFVTKLNRFRGLKAKEYAMLRDCSEEANDSVDRLSNSVVELKKISKARGRQLFWHIRNVQTWVSAALTDYTTCADGTKVGALNGRIKASIRTRMTNAAQITSNALALINQLAGQY